MSSILWPKRYQDGVNFILLFFFFMLFLISCYFLATEKYTSTSFNSISSVAKMSAIFSLAGIGTVIFSGFFKSIGVFKSDKTMLMGAAATFLIFIMMLYTGFQYLSDKTSKQGYEKKISHLESENKKLTSSIDMYRKIAHDSELEAARSAKQTELIDLVDTHLRGMRNATLPSNLRFMHTCNNEVPPEIVMIDNTQSSKVLPPAADGYFTVEARNSNIARMVMKEKRLKKKLYTATLDSSENILTIDFDENAYASLCGGSIGTSKAIGEIGEF